MSSFDFKGQKLQFFRTPEIVALRALQQIAFILNNSLSLQGMIKGVLSCIKTAEKKPSIPDIVNTSVGIYQDFIVFLVIYIVPHF